MPSHLHTKQRKMLLKTLNLHLKLATGFYYPVNCTGSPQDKLTVQDENKIEYYNMFKILIFFFIFMILL